MKINMEKLIQYAEQPNRVFRVECNKDIYKTTRIFKRKDCLLSFLDNPSISNIVITVEDNGGGVNEA